MTGNNPEETPILRLSLGLYKLWMLHLEATGGAVRAPMLDELSDGMDLFCFLLDREAAACLADGPFPRPDAQPSQYPLQHPGYSASADLRGSELPRP
ncbi:hypothetical protein [Nocardia terpenica]|uniref:Uncharacterized protein n=1 Tax=Nocardia terpenica TaxID=455432 RepID=A0A6G9ZD01_9NOCA|nr:hypothetical protein [Nocardia terpenica]QIS23324.1 hypothetical protein F6W96_38310 [Nocardia terpenica]